ncbi:MAG TPA: hypothetical protein DD670_18155 [Planctomycetaceae bacterium]|nr:hypothetical protein [Planctomycetaceae bacterium]
MRIRGKAIWLVLTILALPYIGANCVSRTHDDVFTEEGLLTANASDLRDTIITPHLEAPIEENKNLLWCGSFQLAWNEVCALIAEDVRFADDEPDMVAVLNRKVFTGKQVDAESYVAVAGFVKDDVHEKIKRQLEDTFDGSATPRYLPPSGLTPRPQDIVAYAYLFKNLAFETPFERIEQPLIFNEREVPCFGVGHEYKPGRHARLDQVVLLDYKHGDDFIIELKTKSEKDRLILAKILPERTLGETIRSIEDRIVNAEPIRPSEGDVVKVPRLNFDVTRRYHELEGHRLAVTNQDVADDLIILSAVQNIRFQTDEKGVRLRSESHISIGCSAKTRLPAAEHVMIFDRPFLVLLQRANADVPYFALWVENPELLVKRK